MKVSMKWLNDYVNISDIAPHDFGEDMTMSGSKVESVTSSGDEIKKVVVGKILSREHHPDADKLQICQVDVGEETIQIVTGATNINDGDLVPVALHKSTLPGGVKITRGKLRGVMSNGMMCSHEELGMELGDYAGACEDGILIIKEDVKPGTDIKDVLNLNETVVEFEITSNRADCFSVIGLAREAAVTYGRPLTVKKPEVHPVGGNAADMISIDVQDTELCPRYAARIVKNVKIAPSPEWMVERLKSAGVRSINNVVDITNFVMLEYGQPMHAFDLNYLEGGKIIVRRAEDSEEIVTLDGEKRILNNSMLVIADGKKPVAVAGVMGGENSEITDDTKTILFECANFNGSSVRMTAKKLGLRTEASSRYEKGLDPNMIEDAVNRACELMEMLGAGEVVSGIVDVNNSKTEPRKIPFIPENINKFLGTDIDRDFMVKTLESLDFVVDGDICIPPSYRGDIIGTADVAEEVARIYGYDKIPMTLLSGESVIGGKTFSQKTEDRIKDILVGAGGYEIMTYSFTSAKTFDMLSLPQDSEMRNVIKILNPLGEETSVMRTTTIGSMLETLSRNYNNRNTAAKLFEIGSVYIPTEEGKLPNEDKKVTIGIYGDVDFYDLKGMTEELFDGLCVRKVKYTADKTNVMFHPGRCADVYIGGAKAGVMGEIHPLVCANYDIPVKVYIAEIDLNTILENIDTEKKYKGLPKFPAVSRDLAIVVGRDVPAGDIEELIRKGCGSILEELKLFDVYTGDKIAADKKSVAYALTLRSESGTLKDDEISAVMNKTIKLIEEKLGGTLRS